MPGPALGGTFGERVVLDGAAIAQLLRGPEGPVFRHVTRAAEIVKDGARRRVPVWSPAPGEPAWSVARRTRARRPGTLRDSIVKRVVADPTNGFAILVGSEDKAALWVHEGTQPHTITPSTKPMLVFYWNGSTVRTLRVNHPGTQPNRYLTDALADLRSFT